jgi:hypothetical protein
MRHVTGESIASALRGFETLGSLCETNILPFGQLKTLAHSGATSNRAKAL